MDEAKIPITVAILTRNSGGTLARALESVKGVGEVLVCDGGSTDNTLSIAHSYGARVIPQNTLFQEPDGRLKDWSGVRNECLEAGTYPWHFFLDSDEYASEALIKEIRSIAEKEKPAAYWVPRKYVANGIVIERSLGYPNQQMRFFHRDAVTGFRKPVHERVELEPDTQVLRLTSPILVPVEMNPAVIRAKMDRYIELELTRHSPLTRRAVWNTVRDALKACMRTPFRLVRLLFQRGTRLPLSQDLLGAEYEIRLALRALRSL